MRLFFLPAHRSFFAVRHPRRVERRFQLAERRGLFARVLSNWRSVIHRRKRVSACRQRVVYSSRRIPTNGSRSCSCRQRVPANTNCVVPRSPSLVRRRPPIATNRESIFYNEPCVYCGRESYVFFSSPSVRRRRSRDAFDRCRSGASPRRSSSSRSGLCGAQCPAPARDRADLCQRAGKSSTFATESTAIRRPSRRVPTGQGAG